MSRSPRIALVHDWLNQYGGAERVLEVLHRLYPEAPVFTSIYTPAPFPDGYRSWDIRSTFMNRLPRIHRRHQMYLPLYPVAFDRLDLRGYDVVLSNSSGFCHGVRAPGAVHINYCLTPPRYVWTLDQYLASGERVGGAARAVLKGFLPILQKWDRAAAGRADRIVAISHAVQERVRRYWGRESDVLFPPVEVSRFAVSDAVDDFYLVVSRLAPYKRVDLAVEAFNWLGRPLVIVGDGRDRARLESMAKGNVRFLGRRPDAEVATLYARCRAFLFPGEEDFGITPLEANASGRPVIAYAAGGALDTVREDETGLLFREQTAEALAEAIERADRAAFDSARLRAHAQTFDVAAFSERIRALVDEAAGRG